MEHAESISQKVIVYDNTCPLCCWYTKKFTEFGFLKEENRISFSEISQKNYALDWEKSKHHIPLIDKEGKQTLYGLDSLLFILGQKLPFIKKLFKFAIFYYFFKFLYGLISYNRRVIVPPSKKVNGFDCTPNFHFGYRTLYISLTVLFTFFSFGFQLFYCFLFSCTMILFLAICWMYEWKNIIRFLGQVSSILFCASLFNLISSVFFDQNVAYILVFIIVAQQCVFRIKSLTPINK